MSDVEDEQQEEKKKTGRPPFEPTSDERTMVKICKGFGFPHYKIRLLISRKGKPICRVTLESAFKDELATGKAFCDMRSVVSLMALVQEKNLGAICFYQKTQMGISESPRTFNHNIKRLEDMTDNELRLLIGEVSEQSDNDPDSADDLETIEAVGNA